MYRALHYLTIDASERPQEAVGRAIGGTPASMLARPDLSCKAWLPTIRTSQLDFTNYANRATDFGYNISHAYPSKQRVCGALPEGEYVDRAHCSRTGLRFSVSQNPDTLTQAAAEREAQYLQRLQRNQQLDSLTLTSPVLPCLEQGDIITIYDTLYEYLGGSYSLEGAVITGNGSFIKHGT